MSSQTRAKEIERRLFKDMFSSSPHKRSERAKRSDSPDFAERARRFGSPDRTERARRFGSPDRTERARRFGSPDRTERARRCQANMKFEGGKGVKGKVPDGFQKWLDAMQQARNKIQSDAAASGNAKVHHRTSEGEPVYRVNRNQVIELARQLYYGDKSPPKRKESPSAKAQHIHGMSPRELRKPVTKEEAIQLFLQSYSKQAREGHLSKDRHGNISTKHYFEYPGSALRQRMMRVAKAKEKGISLKKLENHIIPVCPRFPPQTEKEEQLCAESAKLRRRNAWRNYQVPEVSMFETSEKAKQSPLYQDANFLSPHRVSPRKGSPRKGSPRKGSPRKGSPRKGSPRKGSPRKGSKRGPGSPKMRKEQTPESFRERFAAYAEKKQLPMKQNQEVDEWKQRWAKFKKEQKKGSRSPSPSLSSDFSSL